MLYLPSHSLHCTETLRSLALVFSNERFSARVAEIMPTGTGHMRATFRFLNNLPTLSTLPVLLGHFQLNCYLRLTLSFMLQSITVSTMPSPTFFTLQSLPVNCSAAIGSLAWLILGIAEVFIVLADLDDFVLESSWEGEKKGTGYVEGSLAVVVGTDRHGEGVGSCTYMVEETVEAESVLALPNGACLFGKVFAVADKACYLTVLYFCQCTSSAAVNLGGEPFVIGLHISIINLILLCSINPYLCLLSIAVSGNIVVYSSVFLVPDAKLFTNQVLQSLLDQRLRQTQVLQKTVSFDRFIQLDESDAIGLGSVRMFEAFHQHGVDELLTFFQNFRFVQVDLSELFEESRGGPDLDGNVGFDGWWRFVVKIQGEYFRFIQRPFFVCSDY
jgi:hypothetical protein